MANLCSEVLVLRVLYVELPPEANELLDTVWRLQRAMFGTRDAAAAWERKCTRTLNTVGFESGVSIPVLLRCEKMDASMVMHGDDCITLGDCERGVVGQSAQLLIRGSAQCTSLRTDPHGR